MTSSWIRQYFDEITLIVMYVILGSASELLVLIVKILKISRQKSW